MSILINTVHVLFPALGILFLILGVGLRRSQLVSLALWLSLIALVLHYRTSGGEILGIYFNYLHTVVYSINLLVLVSCIIYLSLNYLRDTKHPIIRFIAAVIAVCASVGVVILLINLWINARFIESRQPGTPLLQVATLNQVPYCMYSYVFYKIDQSGKIAYLCPNRYGLIPGSGYLDAIPDFILKQLPPVLQGKFVEKK